MRRLAFVGFLLAASSFSLALVGGCSPSKSREPRVLVIGLDGATFDVLDPLIAAGKLPHIARLQSEGASGILESVLPSISPPAWTTAVTGVNPGKHNIFDFFHFSKTNGEAMMTSARERRARPLWSVLNSQGMKTGLINIPMTFPPDSVDGFMISGFPFPPNDSSPITFPPTLEKELGEYPRDLFGEALRPGLEAKLLERFHAGLESQLRVAKQLMRSEDWRLFWIVFTGTDKVQHFYWKFADPKIPGHDPLLAERYARSIEDFWLRIDQAVGELIETAGEDVNILLVSDHGFSPIYKELRLWNWLKSEGFVTVNDEDPQKPSITAFPPGPFAGIVRVNTKGRDFDGRVAPGEQATAVRDAVRAKLEALRDPEDGEPFVERIYNREELFHGPYAENAPDLIFLERKTRFVGRGGREAPELFGPPSYTFSGFHRPEGILIARGPLVHPNPERGKFSIVDITPTVLWMLDAAAPSDLDGRVMERLVGSVAVQQRPPRASQEKVVIDPSGVAASDEARESLESLSYIK